MLPEQINGTNLEEEFNKEAEKVELTSLQEKYKDSKEDSLPTDYQPATLIESKVEIGSTNNTLYIVMRYKLNDKDVYCEDNFYLSDNSYKHNIKRMLRIIKILGGNDSLDTFKNTTVLTEYLNTFKGKKVLIQQFTNNNGYILCNIKPYMEVE